MGYVKTVWVGGEVPAINAANLNKIEQQLYDLDSPVLSGKYIVDASEVDQGAAGNGKSVKDYVDSIGATKKALLVFPHTGAGNTTTYTFSTNETTTSNITCIFLPGAILSIANGVTVTINGPLEVGLWQIFSGAGTISFGSTAVVREVCPEWWGAIGDDSTDNSTTMQAAATAAAGRTLKISAGTFITDEVSLSNDTLVTGEGDASILKGRAAMAASSGVLSIGNPSKHGIRVKEIAIDGNKASQVNTVFGVAVGDDSYGTRILHSHIYDTSGSCISLSGYNHLVKGNHLHGSKLNAIQANATDAHDIYRLMITQNWIYDLTVDGAGIEFDEGVHDSTIHGNFVWDCISNGIEAENGCYNIVISDNVVYRTTAAAVGAYGILVGLDSTMRTPTITAKNITVSGNIVRNWYRGIYVDTMILATVIGNQALANDEDGIAVTDTSYSVISNNKAANNGQDAANRYGILFTNVDYSTVIGNLAYDTESGGSRTQDKGIHFDATSSYIALAGNLAYNNITTQITSGLVAGSKVGINVGYNRMFLDQYIYTDLYMAERFVPWTVTFVAADATPDIGGGNIFKTNSVAPLDITDFDGGIGGQEITIIGADGGNSTVKHNVGWIKLAGGVDFLLNDGDVLKLVSDGAIWNEISRSDNTP